MQDTQQPGAFDEGGGSFSGHEGTPISLEDATARTAAFRDKYPAQIKANFYGREIIKKILDQPGCVGLRIYNTIHPVTGNLDIILIGASTNLNDILTIMGEKNGDGKGCNLISAIITLPAAAQPTPATIAGNPLPCPACCASNSPLT